MTAGDDASEAVLDAVAIEAGYAPGSLILKGVSMHVDAGEIVTMIGANGAGKSTMLKAIFGLLPLSSGQVKLRGHRIDGLAPHSLVARHLGYVPQVDNIFPTLSVYENIELASVVMPRRSRRARAEAMFEMFPDLKTARTRPSGVLSGGQRQMLAMARALVPEPDVMLLDEPSAGLAPRYVAQVFAKVKEIAAAGVSVMIVEQNARQALAISNRGYVLELGKCRYEGTGVEILNNPDVVEMYLGGRSEPREADRRGKS